MNRLYLPMCLYLSILIGMLACPNCSNAAPMKKKDIPDPLKPWINWVLHGEEDDACPLIYNHLSEKVCQWPSELTIHFARGRARFAQNWEIYAKNQRVCLPGNQSLWPTRVEINGKEWPVGIYEGQPVVFLEKKGHYEISGEFHFERQPEWVQIPKESGLVKLLLADKEIPFPRLDKKGRLWLKLGQKNSDPHPLENRFKVQVHRLIKDTIPLRIETDLDLYISGKHRTIDIGAINLNHVIPFAIESKLPVKLEATGHLLIQARPGKWKMRVIVRYKDPPPKLGIENLGHFNAFQEIWSFEAHHNLRMVDISGPLQIDPQQTPLPDAWKAYPAYLMKPDTRMTFIEKKRGDPQPAPDKLSLNRVLRLDFDGKGFSVRDHISGTMTTGWRLSVRPPIEPGRMMLDNQEQFITSLEGQQGKAGIEMRYGNVNLVAESRINQTGEIPVVGWDRDFHSVRGQLYLPPGWSLFDASGIDNIQTTWLQSWTLMDLFLVLIISLSVVKLFSYRWGALTIMTLVLIHQEPGAPCWVFLNILAAVALLRVMPKGKIHSFMHNYRLLCLASLILISLPFMVKQVKYGIYPQLKYPFRAMDRKSPSQLKSTMADKAIVKPPAASLQSAIPNRRKLTQKRRFEPYAAEYDRILGKPAVDDEVHQFDANAKIQTGAGMPTWQWEDVKFSFNGPVKADETLSFVLLTPRMNMILGFVRVIMLGILLYGLAGIKFAKSKGIDFSNIKPAALLLSFFMVLLIFQGRTAMALNAFPDEALLTKLKNKLIEDVQPDCAPQCAVYPRGKLVIEKDRLKMVLEVHCLYSHLAVPLPGSAKHWLPSTVLLNGKPVSGLFRDPKTGYLWIRATEGIHRLLLSGPMPQRKTVQLPFPMNVKQMDISAAGWEISGLHENGVIDNQLQFSRINRAKKRKEVFETDLLPHFLEITRIFHIGLTWKIETFVKRMTPLGVAVLQQIPLLPGESVTSDIPLKNGKILLNMGPNQRSTSFISSLEKTNPIQLQAANTLDYSEIWKFDISTLWHSDINGIPVIHHQNRAGRWFPEYRPWPEESLTLHISRPQGVAGQTTTIEKSVLTLKPGKRMTNADLDLVIRSSRGSRHIVRLPSQSKLYTLLINGKSQPITQTHAKVVLPLSPGIQNVKLSFKTPNGMELKWRALEVDAGMSSVNAYTTVTMPQNRWLLFCWGPTIGPAVLFWSSLIVLLFLSLILGKIKYTPLKHYHWFLLGVGLTQVSILSLLPVAVWLIALGLREQKGSGLSAYRFNLFQVLLIALTVLALTVLFNGIHNGLLGAPNMQISGNGSYDHTLKWYQDIAGKVLPQPVVFSLPMTVYRVLILAWALWIAFALVRWLRWGWECYSRDGLWRKTGFRGKKKVTSRQE